MLIVTYVIGTILGTALGNSIFDTHNAFSLDLFNMDLVSKSLGDHIVKHIGFIEFILGFALIQSIFLLGSVYFKRNAIGKTFLTIISLGIIIGLIELIIFKVSFGAYNFTGQSYNLYITMGDDLFPGFEVAIKTLKYLLIPFFWVVSYFRLTEKQV
jgi:glycerol uptake facilitator-like aquaporin